MFLLIGFLIILIDQIIKIIITANISYGLSIGKWIKITNISNTGIAYGIRRWESKPYNYCKYFNYICIINFFSKELQKYK